MADKQSILVLGASGWIGYYLVPLLGEAGACVTAAYATRVPDFIKPPENALQISSLEYRSLDRLHFDVIINLARGEKETDFQFHQYLIDLANSRNVRYIYASSFNAVDQNVSRPHLESDQPSSQTDYGKFKARCENELMAKGKRPVILRFSGVHGWAPNRVARTEEFLQQLAKGDPVPVYGSLLQNRIFVDDLARQIAIVAKDEGARGVFHLGASDFSEELEFHQKLASAFGYHPQQVVLGKFINWNAVMVLQRFTERYPEFRIPTEDDTIRGVRNQPQLAKYARI